MKPSAFDYIAVETLAEAATALGEHGDKARIIAGGQSLMAMLNMRLTQPGVIVDISSARDGGTIDVSNGYLRVGATVTQAQLGAWPSLGDVCPLLKLAIPHIGHIQTRSRGTVCGSLCHADPSSELPLVLATLQGQVRLLSSRGERSLSAEDFQIGMLVTRKQPDEIVAEARFPIAKPGQRFGFNEVSRRHGDFAIVSLACMVDGDSISLGIGGVADRPTVALWKGLKPTDLGEALNAFAWDLGGYEDIHASARYRRELVRRLGRNLVMETAQWNA